MNEIYMHQWIPVWLQVLRPGLSPSSQARYQQESERNLLPWFGKLPVSAIDVDQVLSYIHFLQDVGLTRNGQRFSLRTLHSCLDLALSYHLIPYDPTKLIHLPSAPPSSGRVLHDHEIAALLSCNFPSPWKDLFCLILLTGLRIGEALALQGSDYDAQRKTLHIQRQLIHYNQSGHTIYQIVPYTKNRIERRIFLPKAADNILQKHDTCSSFLFHTADGNYLPYYKVHRRFHKLSRQLGIADVKIHSLRHTAASIAYAQTHDLRAVQHFLGHSSINSTLRYMHPTDTETRLAADAIDSFFQSITHASTHTLAQT